MSVPPGRNGLCAVALSLAMCAWTAASTDPPRDKFDELYARGQTINAALRTLTAKFTETSASTLLTKPITTHGRLWVERPSRIIMRYTDPDSRVVLIDGNRMTMTWPSRSLNQTLDIGPAQGRVQKYFINGSASDLRRQFAIDTRDDGGGVPNTYYVTMTPKRKQILEALSRLELWIDRSSLVLARMQMTFANGDVKTMTFEDVVQNAPLAPGTFDVDR